MDSAVLPITDGVALGMPGTGLLLTLGFCAAIPSSVAALLPRLERSGFGLES